MKLDTIVTERLQQLKLFTSQPSLAGDMVDDFAQAWRELGCQILQQQLQEQLESAECPPFWLTAAAQQALSHSPRHH